LYWFSDGYADYLRHFSWVMGALPEYAPVGESHLLRSTSVVQKVNYGASSVGYRTFDRSATEVLRLAFRPARVTAGGAALAERADLKDEGYTLQSLSGGDYVVRLRHRNSGDVSISATAP
jgi:hypothetical protein